MDYRILLSKKWPVFYAVSEVDAKCSFILKN